MTDWSRGRVPRFDRLAVTGVDRYMLRYCRGSPLILFILYIYIILIIRYDFETGEKSDFVDVVRYYLSAGGLLPRI